MTRLSFLGWSEDGRRFLVRAEYGRDMEALAGNDLLELFEVHDALTGQTMASFRVRSGRDRARLNPLFKAARREARPRKAWKTFRTARRWLGRRSRRRSPAGWLVKASVSRAPRHGHLSIKTTGKFVSTAWEGFSESLRKPSGKGERGPSVRLFAVRGKERWPLLRYQVPFTLQDIWAGKEYTGHPGRAVGRVKTFWSPAGSAIGARVFIVLHADLEGWTDETPLDSDRYYLRSVGPQILIETDVAHEGQARRICERMATAGLAVTQLSLKGKARPTTLIYHRGSRGLALAERVAGVLGIQAERVPLKKRGWLNLVVLLGRDAFGTTAKK